MDFKELVGKAGRNNTYQDFPVLALDPGHTTGWAFFEEAELKSSDQIDTSTIEACARNATELFQIYHPQIVVMEDYRVYAWRQKQHVGSEMMTTRVIGALELMSMQHHVPHIIKQPAHVAKGFCDDKKLKEWGMYQKGQRHARDAIRHGCYFILFGAIRPQDKPKRPTVG